MASSVIHLAGSESALQAPQASRLIVEAFRGLGWVARDVRWDLTEPDGTPVLVRHTWDYHRRLDEFLSWMDRLEETGSPTHDPPRWIRWNADKRYLTELGAAGIPVAKTRFIGASEAWPSVESLQDELGARDFVVKPTVAATAWRTARVSANDPEAVLGAIRDAGRGADVMVQPYLDGVQDGEWSLVYIGGRLSHTVLKTARGGDFRVQKDFGGAYERRDPPASVRDAAEAVMAFLGEDLAYARVDGIVHEGRYLLMELELIEPDLFLELEPEAPITLARWIVERL